MKRLLLAVCFLLVTSCVSRAQMTFVNGGANFSATASCTVTLSVTSGNTLLAAASSTSSPGTVTFTASDGTNTYTSAFAAFADSGTNTKTQAWTAPVTATNAALVVTLTASSSSNYITCAVLQYSNAIASPVDGTPATASNIAVTSLTTGTTGTTAQAKETLVGIFGLKPPSSTVPVYTAGANFTSRANSTPTGATTNPSSIYLEDRNVTATGTYTATATTNQTSSGGGIIVALKAGTSHGSTIGGGKGK